jgi:threonine/homoserine/homoserine lactone efflux protein
MKTGRCSLRRDAAGEALASLNKNSSAKDLYQGSHEGLMSNSLLIAFVLFASVMFFTPGPNNIMLLSSGLTYGFRPTIPHIAGITFGFAFMVGAVGLGLGTIFITFPVLQTILKYAGVAYLIYLAAAIAMSGPVSAGQDNRRGPMTFLGAAMFQWINVKGWVMVIGTITAYAAISPYPWNIVIQVGLSLLLGALSCTVWALFGSALRPVLTSPRAVRAFNIVMAVLLLASLYPVFMDT